MQALERLERPAVKVARAVLRGGSGSNVTSLPDAPDITAGEAGVHEILNELVNRRCTLPPAKAAAASFTNLGHLFRIQTLRITNLGMPLQTIFGIITAGEITR